MSNGRTGFLSSHSTTTCWPGLERKVDSAAKRAPRPVFAAHAKASYARKGLSHDSLADEHPNLALQWVPESNGSQTPQSVAASSQFKAAWRCGRRCEHCGTPHEWTARVCQRSQLGHGCPLCSGLKPCRCRSLAAMHPQLMKQWDLEGNQGIDPYSTTCHSEKKVSWICTEHGQWNATPKSRLYYGTGCPECARQRSLGRSFKRGCMKDEMPGMYAELHPSKNSGVDIERLTCGSRKRVWWLCQSSHGRPEGCQHVHEWDATIKSRCTLRKPTGCPFCDGRRVCPCQSLAKLQQALLQYWDDAANAIPLAEPLDPSWLGVSSNRKVWWRHKCAEGQVCHWNAAISSVSSRFKKTGRVPCPGCAAQFAAATFAERRGKLIKRNC